MSSPVAAVPHALPDGDVIKILLEQHARIRELFSHVKSAEGEHKQQTFDELRALLAVHETAEEMVLRPVSRQAAGEAVADARNDEEKQANKVLKELEDMDVSSAEFDQKLGVLEKAVSAHAENEESEEFPACSRTAMSRSGPRWASRSVPRSLSPRLIRTPGRPDPRRRSGLWDPSLPWWTAPATPSVAVTAEAGRSSTDHGVTQGHHVRQVVGYLLKRLA